MPVSCATFCAKINELQIQINNLVAPAPLPVYSAAVQDLLDSPDYASERSALGLGLLNNVVFKSVRATGDIAGISYHIGSFTSFRNGNVLGKNYFDIGELYIRGGTGLSGEAVLRVSGGATIGSGYDSIPMLNGNMIIEGRIGIGTPNPQATLDLGSGTDGKALTWGGINGSARYASVYTSFASASLVIATGYHGSTTSDTEVSSHGAQGAKTGIKLNLVGPNTGSIQFFADVATTDALGTPFTPVERMRLTPAGFLGIGTVSPVLPLSVIKSSASYPQLRLGSNQVSDFWDLGTRTGTDGRFQIVNSSGLEALSIIPEGNVGIGAPNPISQLTVYSPHTLGVNGSENDLTFVYNELNNYRTSLATNFDGSTPSNNRLVFRISDGTHTGQVDAMTLSGLGNVGIGGAASLIYKLDVTGTLNISGAATVGSLASAGAISGVAGIFSGVLSSAGVNITGGNWLQFESINTIFSSPGVGFFIQQPNGATKTQFLSSAGVIHATIDTGGNFGIGTTTPSASKLQIVDSGSGITHEKTAGGFFTSLGFNGNNPYLTYYGDDRFTLGYGSSTGGIPSVNTLTLTTAGKVGIGVTNPISQLTVISPNSLGVNGSASDLTFVYDPSNNFRTSLATNFDGSTPSNNRLVFKISDGTNTGQVDAMMLNGLGNVGIGGAASLTYKLDVVGNLNASGAISGNTGTFSDLLQPAYMRIDGPVGAGLYSLYVAGADGADRDIALFGATGLSNGLTVRRVSGAMLYSFMGGNVGIGITNPSAKLDVAGSVNATTYYGSGSNLTGISFVNSTDGDRNAGAKLPTTSPRGVRFDFSEAVYTGTGGNYAGVMTYAPYDGASSSAGDASYQLVFGSTAIDGDGIPQLNIRKGINSTWNSWLTIPLLQPTAPGTQQAGTLNLSGNALFGGNVGIGTATPGAKLEIATVTGTTGLSVVGLDTNGYSVAEIKSVGTAGYSRLFFSDTAAQSGQIEYNHGLDAMSLGTAGTPKVTILNTGNVGIGTTTPGVRLQVHGVGYPPGPSLGSGVVGQFALISQDGGYGICSGISPNGDTWFQSQRIDGAGITYNILLNPSGGNVGIGTTTPVNKLVVSGGANGFEFSPGGTGSTSTLIVYDRVAELYGPLNIDSSDLRFRASGVEKLRITSDGNVGIGTTTPGYPLDVAGTVSATTIGVIPSILAISNGQTVVRMDSTFVNADWRNWAFATSSAVGGDFTLFVGASQGSNPLAGTAVISALLNGNVGIGTSSPASKLTVGGGDVEVITVASGVIMKSPDGTRYRVTVANGGSLATALA